ncbi:MAG: hypothetical protein M4579_001550 [Chaenotheca gracillima]|nr:MAG: hypothetical protein M4579_001550 [Chaenotheca gracillima]
MPKKRVSAASTAVSSKTPPNKGSASKKRQSSTAGQADQPTSTPTRSSKRLKPLPGETRDGQEERTPVGTSRGHTNGTKKATPKKSQYFEGDETESELSDASDGAKEDDSSSAYEEEEVNAPTTDTSAAEDEDESGYSEDDVKSSKKKTARQIIVSGGNKTNGSKDMWRPGVNSGLGPGKRVVVRLPKPREAGSTPYTDETIHPNTLLFLGDLARNNDREWLKMHDPDFRTSEKDFDSFVGVLTEKIIEKDETIPELPVKDIKFRIYRDIRFSPDPTPYKDNFAHFSAAWSRTGRKGPYAAYYVQVAPGKSFIGGGLWHPDAIPLHSLRRSIDRKPRKIKNVLTDARLRKEFLGGIPKDENKAVRAFVEHNKESALKTKPKGYDADHPNISLLRLRNYTIGKKLQDREVVGPGGLARISDLMGVLTPFITHLNSIVMPDEPPSDDDEEEEDEEEEGEEEEADEEDTDEEP